VHPHCGAKRINHNAMAWIGLRKWLRKYASAQVGAGAKADKLKRAGQRRAGVSFSAPPASAARGRSGLRMTNLSSGEYVAAPAAAP
jgi:hypothetical protein